MSDKKSNQEKKDKQVDIVFDIEKIDADPNATRVYGIDVEPGKKGKLVGKTAESIRNAMLDAGRCDK